MTKLVTFLAAILVTACSPSDSGSGGDAKATSDTYQGTGRNEPDHGDVGGNGKNYDRGGPPTRELQNSKNGAGTNQLPAAAGSGAAR